MPCRLVELNGDSEEPFACLHTLIMETADFSETSVDIYQATDPHIPEGSNQFFYNKDLTVVGLLVTALQYILQLYLTSVSFLDQQRPKGNLLTNYFLEVEHNFSQQHRITLSENSRLNCTGHISN
jgi:hypothetical protein